MRERTAMRSAMLGGLLRRVSPVSAITDEVHDVNRVGLTAQYRFGASNGAALSAH